MTTAPSTVGSGRYRLIERLGGGHTSETFLALHEERGAVVVKRFSTRHADSWKRVELAEREALVLQRLNHELLPRYLDHFEEGGALYTVMTRVEGEDLAGARRHGRVFGEREIWALLRDGAAALAYLHGQLPPLVHRDLKPSNILLGADGRYRIVDLGAVAELRGEVGSTVVGTFGYMAPEQFQGRTSPASDIYSLGATALSLLTRTEPEKLPHVGLGIDVRRALGRAVTQPLLRTLEAMLRPEPERRPVDLRRLVSAAAQPRPRAAGPSSATHLSPVKVSRPAALGSVESWPAWKKGAVAAILVLLLGRVLSETNFIGTLALVALPLLYAYRSMLEPKAPGRRTRVDDRAVRSEDPRAAAGARLEDRAGGRRRREAG